MARLLHKEHHLDETKKKAKDRSGILKLKKMSATRIIYTIEHYVTAFLQVRQLAG